MLNFGGVLFQSSSHHQLDSMFLNCLRKALAEISTTSKIKGGSGLNNNLVGGFNPSEKYARQIWFIFPNFRDENKAYLSCHHPDNPLL